MTKLQFPNKNRMWDFIDDHHLRNYSATNTTYIIVFNPSIDQNLINMAITIYGAKEL